MARYEHFHDLPVWLTAKGFYHLVLNLFEEHGGRFSPGFRGQLDRAALSVSNNIAEGFDRVTTAELLAFLGYARGSAWEVRSMALVMKDRRAVTAAGELLTRIDEAAFSCIRQLAAWTAQIESGPVQGKRHLTQPVKHQRSTAVAADKFRLDFLRKLDPKHALYNSPEAKAARGE